MTGEPVMSPTLVRREQPAGERAVSLPASRSCGGSRRGDLVTVEDAGNEVAGLVHLNGRDIAVVGEKGRALATIKAVTGGTTVADAAAWWC
jgi:hypothetical protein